MKKGVGGIGVLVLCLVINFLFVGMQNLSHAPDQQRLDQLKKQLETDRIQIESIENELKNKSLSLDQMQTRLSTLETQIKSIESKHPNGIPSSIYADYSSKVDELNSFVSPYNSAVSEFKTKYAEYSSRIDQYNTMVDEANALGKKVGTTWVIVPRLGAFR